MNTFLLKLALILTIATKANQNSEGATADLQHVLTARLLLEAWGATWACFCGLPIPFEGPGYKFALGDLGRMSIELFTTWLISPENLVARATLKASLLSRACPPS